MKISTRIVLAKKTLCLSTSLAAVIVTAATTELARATLVVVDQQSTLYTTDVIINGTSPSLGQSFTPSLSLIDFATFVLASNVSATYRVDLYAGSGTGGMFLGSSGAQSLAVGVGGQEQPVEFDFASAIALTPGSPFTLQLALVSGPGGNSALIAKAGFPNPYAGGTALPLPDQSGFDLVFSEGVHNVAATPETGSSLLLLLTAVSLMLPAVSWAPLPR